MQSRGHAGYYNKDATHDRAYASRTLWTHSHIVPHYPVTPPSTQRLHPPTTVFGAGSKRGKGGSPGSKKGKGALPKIEKGEGGAPASKILLRALRAQGKSLRQRRTFWVISPLHMRFRS